MNLCVGNNSNLYYLNCKTEGTITSSSILFYFVLIIIFIFILEHLISELFCLIKIKRKPKYIETNQISYPKDFFQNIDKFKKKKNDN